MNPASSVAFKKSLRLNFIKWKPTPLEVIESVDMLRVLEHGCKIKLIETQYKTMGVDNESDRRKVEKLMHSDSLFTKYKL